MLIARLEKAAEIRALVGRELSKTAKVADRGALGAAGAVGSLVTWASPLSL